MRKFLSAPYWIHILVDTIIGQFIWWVVSMIIGTPILVRSIIAGAILIAVIFAVALYLPKISPIGIGGKPISTKRQKSPAMATTLMIESVCNKLEAVIKAGTINPYLDICITRAYWQGLEEPYLPYLVLEVLVTNRLPLDLIFVDIHNIPYILTVIDESGKGSPICKKSELVWLESTTTGKPIPFNGQKQIPESSNFTLDFQFRWDDCSVRNELKNAYKGVPKIKIGLLPKWQLKTPDGRIVCFTANQPIVKEFDAPWKDEPQSVLEF